jgi:hypothetical protein
VCVSPLLASNLPFCHSFLLGFKSFALSNVISSCHVFRGQFVSPIRVLTADMFSTPSTSFDLPSYAADIANILAEAPSPSPSPPRPLNSQALVFLDIEAVQCEDSDGHVSPSP